MPKMLLGIILKLPVFIRGNIGIQILINKFTFYSIEVDKP
jgi:hypothetical protein